MGQVGRTQNRQQQNIGITSLIVVAFAVICAAGMGRHEMWRDELQIWMLARDSGSWLELLQNLRYETGHPFLWYVCLFGLSRWTRSPIAMQAFHLAIATASIFLLVRFSPFSWMQKALFAFGYFALYEYGIISRNYGLGLLLLFGACVLIQQRRQRYWPIAGLLFLAANTNFYALICAAAIALLLSVDFCHQPRSEWNLRQRIWDLGLSLIIVVAGISLYYWQLLPPADGGISPGGLKPLTIQSVTSAIAVIGKSYLPLPWLTLNFWNTNFFREGDAALLAIALMIGTIAVFIRKPLILLLYTSGTSAIVLIALLKHGGGVRHWGFAFVLLVICFWLAPEFPEASWKPPRFWLRLHFWLNQQHCRLFTGILLVQLLAGAFAYGMDWVFPFSQAQATAQFIQQQNMTAGQLVGDRDWAALTVSGFLDQPLYYPASDRIGTFIIWNNQRFDRPLPEVIDQIQQQAQPGQSHLLVLNYPLQPAELALFKAMPVEVSRFTGAIVTDENYYLYRLPP